MYSIKIPRAELFAKVSFVLFMFFTIFTTSLPFQESIQESGEVRASNMINVLLYPFLFMLSFIAYLPKHKELMNMFKKEKMYSVFLLWALLSIVWSSYPSVSLKRWFQIFDYMFIIAVYFTYCNSVEDVINAIKPVVYLYLVLSILVVFTVSGAIDPRFGTWRGLTSHKNSLGEVSMICVLLTIIFYKYDKTLIRKSITIFFLLISMVLLVGANSSTALINFMIFASSSTLFILLSAIFDRIGVGRFASLISITTILILFLLVYTQAPELIEAMDVTGKDVTTLSDRTFLWEYILDEISSHPITGCGFRGFWVVDSPGMEKIQHIFPFMPIQAHSGYLDITNEVGLIGIGFFAFILINYFVEVKKIGNQDVWIWFIILPLVGNITETTLFREGSISQVFFTLAYLIPFVFQEDNMYEPRDLK